jgi:antitoxin ParD1/3/4
VYAWHVGRPQDLEYHVTISLPPELERFVQEKVQSGQYPDPAAVVRGALEVLQEQEALTPEDIVELRAAIAVGRDQLDRGEGTPWDVEEIKQSGRRLLAARKDAREARPDSR